MHRYRVSVTRGWRYMRVGDSGLRKVSVRRAVFQCALICTLHPYTKQQTFSLFWWRFPSPSSLDGVSMCVESQWCVVIQVYILALFICRFLKDWYLSLCQMELLWTTFSNVELTVLDSDSRLRWGAGLAHPDPLIRVWISLVPRFP